MEARLPHDKLEKCRNMLQDFLKRRKVSLREMQSLIGLLNFTWSVVQPGRTFLRRMINVTVGVRRPTHLRSFPSIALRIPTAHNFTRD